MASAYTLFAFISIGAMFLTQMSIARTPLPPATNRHRPRVVNSTPDPAYGYDAYFDAIERQFEAAFDSCADSPLRVTGVPASTPFAVEQW